MKEHPILFSSEMVRAILEGRKTQTRRVMKPQPVLDGVLYEWAGGGWGDNIQRVKPLMHHHSIPNRCPYGQWGDRLWVRETWQMVYERMDGQRFTQPIDNARQRWVEYAATPHDEHEPPKWKPSIHMPRKYSRINLEITDLWIERLQVLTFDDALAEGIKRTEKDDYFLAPLAGAPDYPWVHPVPAFMSLWNSINDKRGYGWEVNPWVWVIEFKRVA